MKRIIIIGATSGIAEQCARLWVCKPVELILVGRNQERLDLIAQDLIVRSPNSSIKCVTTEFEDALEIEMFVAHLSQTPVDIVLVAHGAMPDQASSENDLKVCKAALVINGVSPVLFAEAFAGHMARANQGTLAVIGSVAGDRGRKSNYVYGAGKGLVTRYVQGLQHRLAKTAVGVVLVKPGPTDTPMTAKLKANGLKMATPQAVARDIVNGIEAKKPVIYAPKKWRYIMMVIRHIPKIFFDRLDI